MSEEMVHALWRGLRKITQIALIKFSMDITFKHSGRDLPPGRSRVLFDGLAAQAPPVGTPV